MKNELTIKILKMEENLVDKDHVKQILNYMNIILGKGFLECTFLALRLLYILQFSDQTPI